MLDFGDRSQSEDLIFLRSNNKVSLKVFMLEIQFLGKNSEDSHIFKKLLLKLSQ